MAEEQRGDITKGGRTSGGRTRSGRGGGRGGRSSSSGRGGVGGRNQSARSSAYAGRGGGRSANHGRHPKQPNTSSSDQQHPHQLQRKSNQAGRGRTTHQRPRSSSQSDVAAARKSIEGPYAHLYCSERHGFALSRVFYPRNETFLLPSCHKELKDGSSSCKITSDQLERWWEAVKVVRCHVPFNEHLDGTHQSSRERCPICLDEEMISPFIAPCGHSFCLPCVLGYLNSVTKDLNAESERIKKSKQQTSNNTGMVGSSEGLISRTTVTNVMARCPMCSSGSSMVLNAGESVITYKDMRPVVFVPVAAVNVASAREGTGRVKKNNQHHKCSNHQMGTRMKFVKLHRLKGCAAPYLPLHGSRVRGFVSSTSTTSNNQPLPDLPDGDDDAEECTFARQYFVGSDEYDRVLQCDLNDLITYREKDVHCQLDQRERSNVSMAIEAIKASQRRWSGSTEDDGGFKSMELSAKSESVLEMEKSRMVESVARDESLKQPTLLQPGTSYLHQPTESNAHHDDVEEFLYYQASDGQLCYLSGIDVACLMHEFSLHRPEEESHVCDDADNQHTTIQTRNTLPLPDEITGTVIGIEQLVVTQSLVKRKHFLSHLPLTASVTFLEIDWHNGGDGNNKSMISQSTLSKFRGELQRRKSERLRIAQQENKADKAARLKSEKEERRRRVEAFGSDFVGRGTDQTIDPNDEFFRAPSASMDEAEDATEWNPTPTFRFNEVCAEGGVWPELAPVSLSSPILTATSQASPRVSNTWGSRSHSLISDSKPSISTATAPLVSPSLSEASQHKSQRSKSKLTPLSSTLGLR